MSDEKLDENGEPILSLEGEFDKFMANCGMPERFIPGARPWFRRAFYAGALCGFTVVRVAKPEDAVAAAERVMGEISKFMREVDEGRA